jgi:hypothetical protein
MTQLQLPDEVMLPVRKLQGLRGLFVRLPGDPSMVRAAEELRLQRLATYGEPGGLKAKYFTRETAIGTRSLTRDIIISTTIQAILRVPNEMVP